MTIPSTSRNLVTRPWITAVTTIESTIKNPTLLLWGRDDRVTPLERALFMVQQLPNAELHVVSKCGHWVMIEHPELFNRLCLEFLDRE